MDGIESRFVIGPSNIQSGGVYVCTFQPGNLQAVAVKVLKLALFLTTCVWIQLRAHKTATTWTDCCAAVCCAASLTGMENKRNKLF